MSKPLVFLDRTCEFCGKELWTRTPGNVNPKRYCSNTCRFYAWEEKKVLELLRQRRLQDAERHDREKVHA